MFYPPNVDGLCSLKDSHLQPNDLAPFQNGFEQDYNSLLVCQSPDTTAAFKWKTQNSRPTYLAKVKVRAHFMQKFPAERFLRIRYESYRVLPSTSSDQPGLTSVSVAGSSYSGL
jgi:hypothetical protein